MSRKQYILNCIAEGKEPNITPETNEEINLLKLAKAIANGGGSGGGASTWDELEGKPFGEEVTATNVLEWDGDTTDLESVDIYGDGSMLVYKVSDYPVSIGSSDIVGWKVTMMADGDLSEFSLPLTQGDNTITLTADNYVDGKNAGYPSGTYIIMLGVYISIIIVLEDFTLGEMTIAKGIYFRKMVTPFENICSVYVKSIEATSDVFSKEVIHKLDSKFLPEHLQFGVEGNAECLLEEKTYNTIVSESPFNTTELTLPVVIPFVLDKDYTLSVNGTYYVCTCKTISVFGDTMQYCGDVIRLIALSLNQSIEEIENSTDVKSTGEPFVMAWVEDKVRILFFDAPETVKFGIYDGIPTVKKLNNKFIDAEWMAKEEVVTGEIPLDITWDGDVNNSLHCVETPVGYFCKVADYVITDDELKTCIGTVTPIGGADETTALSDIWENEVQVIGENTMILGIVVVRNSAEFSGAIGVTGFETGIYFMKTEDDGYVCYPSNLKSDFVTVTGTTTTATPLPEKFLPELTSFTMVSPSGKKYKVTIDDTGEFVKTEI